MPQFHIKVDVATNFFTIRLEGPIYDGEKGLKGVALIMS